jgi:hypothetical protein
MRRFLRSAILFGALSLLGACDGCSESEGSSVCEEAYGDECGKPCTGDADCVTGLHCGIEGSCTAECTPRGSECGAGECDARGRCWGQGGAGGGGGSTGTFGVGGSGTGGGGVGGGCASVEVSFEPQTPTVVLLIDQSGSMTAAFSGGNRWDVLYDTLMDPTTGIVATLESQVRFGLALYTGDGGGNCPMLTQVTPPALDNRAAIDAVYAPQAPIGETPTGDSITAITPALLAFGEPGPKAIVLATDGEPDTCEVPNPQTGQAEAIAAAQAAYASGIATYIIAVGDQVSAQHQQDMANAGLGLPLDGTMGNAPYYPANDQAALASAFQTIIDGVRSCTLALDGSIDPSKACEGTVYLDGVPLPCNDPNGWQLVTPTEIELLGDACETIQSGSHTVTGSFPCDAIIPQ